MSLSWQALPQLSIRLGANNVLDESPPFGPYPPPFGNGNTLPGYYDTLGTYWFTQLSLSL